MSKENFQVVIRDEVDIRDNLNKKKPTIHSNRPKGKIEVFELFPSGEKKLLTISNLVVYVGRSLICERIFDLENIGNTTTKDEFLSWIGVGRGGAPPGDPLVPVAPTLNDTNLEIEVPLSNSAGPTLGDLRGGDYYKVLFDSVEFEQDPANDDEFLIAKTITTIDEALANGYDLNEVGAFSAESRTAGYSGDFHLYARATFPTIVKSSLRSLQFVWYFFF